MKKIRIKRGDTVEILTGKREDKGKRAEVIKVIPQNRRVVVQAINIHKKHQSQVQTQGKQLNPGIIELEGPMDISNVMVVCPSCNEASRLGIRRDAEGYAHRFCKKCNSELD